MYKVKIVDVESGELLIIMNDKDANEMGINRHDRVRISTNKKFLAAIVQISKTMLKEGEIGVYKNVAQELGLKEGDMVQVAATEKPKSIEFIKKKMDGHELTKDEIRAIVKDITEHNLSDIEMSAYVSAMYMREMNMRETADLTMAMVESGEIIEFDRKPVFDFHSVGGCPGNKVTLLIVPIVAAAGLMIPKTSSRAISSACG
ncbi:MAG: thymidine phosphorylase, partial [Thermoplasmata archaeon]